MYLLVLYALINYKYEKLFKLKSEVGMAVLKSNQTRVRPVARICVWGVHSTLCAREKICNHTHLFGYAHQINNAKATEKCVPSGRNGDVLVVKSIIFRI